MVNSVTSVAGEATATRLKVEGMKGELPHSFLEAERMKVRYGQGTFRPASRRSVVFSALA